MEEKRNYVIYTEGHWDKIERVVKMTEKQAESISWFIDHFGIDGCVELADNYMKERKFKMKLTNEEVDLILCMLDAIEDEWGLNAGEFELKGKIERWMTKNGK